MNQPRSDSPETPPSSGAQTPTYGADHKASVSSQVVNSVTSMWGLIRRFSSEENQFSSQVSEALFGPSVTPGPKDGINGVYNPAYRTASPFQMPPLDPLVLHGYKDNTPPTARLLSHAVAEEIRAMVPERLRIVEDWRLVYSLEQDGASLGTLFQKCRDFDGMRAGFVLVVRDQEGAVSTHLVLPHIVEARWDTRG